MNPSVSQGCCKTRVERGCTAPSIHSRRHCRFGREIPFVPWPGSSRLRENGEIHMDLWRWFVLALFAFAALPATAQQCAFTVESEWQNPDPPLPLWGDQAFCYFTGVSGSFRGGDEMARVRQRTDGTWVLEGSS